MSKGLKHVTCKEQMFSLKKRRSWGILMHRYDGGREQENYAVSGPLWQEIQAIPLKHLNVTFYYKGDQVQEHIAKKGCGVSVLGDIQNLAGNGPE